MPRRRLSESHGDLALVRLDGPPACLHLTHQGALDALGLDDRIDTGHLDSPGGADLPHPHRARRSAFHQHATWTASEARPLREAQALLATLVVHHGFDVPEGWLS